MTLSFPEHQVFLNYPFDEGFEQFAQAMHFAVVSSNLIPVCAKDVTSPDQLRLEALVNAILSCQYSLHDFSLLKGEGILNFARLNMSLEMGMGLFHALQTQRRSHRCAFFVASPHDYQIAASDLAGLDPLCYDGDEVSLVTRVYEWLRDVAQNPLTTRVSTPEIKEKYQDFKQKANDFIGSGKAGRLSHNEAQEVMFQVCSEQGLWDWRDNKLGQLAFPSVPLALRNS